MDDAITKEESNYLRIAHLILRVAPTAVRIKFDAEFHPSGLRIVLNKNRFKYLEPLRQKRVINQKQWDLLFPVSGTTCSETFDVSLMICLIRNLTNITVVDTCPHLNDTSAGADLSRIKYYRNRITHSDSGTITDADFITYWQDITQALIRLGGRSYQEKCNDLRSSKFDKSDKEIITELRNIVLSSDPIPKGVRSIHVVKISEWKVIEEKVVVTSAMKNIEQELQTHDVVTVVGSGGCGKSTSIHHVALLLESKFGYNILPLNSPADILRYYNPDCMQVFVVDDACGKYSVDLQMVREWDLASNDIKAVLSNKTIKLLVTCRSHIFLSRHFQIIKLLSDSKYDLNSTTNSLKYIEKKLIAKAYLNDVEIEQISEHIMLYDFFPMLCQIYSANKTVDIKTFFTFPVQVIKDDLTRMMNAVDRTTYAVLVLFVIYNNDLQQELLSRSSDIKSILDDIVDVCELQFNLSKQILKSHLDNLEGSYIRKTGNAYHVLSDKIFDIVVAFYGNHMFDYILEMAHSEIIRDRYLFSSLEDDDVECVIKVQLDKEQPYFDRVISDIRNGFLCNVFNNRQLLYTAYRQKFVQYLESHTEISKLLEMSSQSELSPLLTIADQGYHDIVETLINFKLDVDVRDKNGRTPLFLSSRKGYKEMTLLLLKNNCNPNLCTNDRLSPLYAATSQGHIEVVNILLQHGSVPDLCDKRGRSPLLLAASDGSTKIVEALLECSSNPNLSDQEGTTPLLIATHWGNTNTVKLLLEKKCCPNLCKEGLSPPLNVAVANGQIEIVKLLLKHKCDPNSLDKQDLPTLYVAARKSFIEILDILLQNLDVNDKTRVESLLTSITRSEEHVLKLLLEHKCIPSIQEKLPILGCAVQLDKRDIAEILLQNDFHSTICKTGQITSNNVPDWLHRKFKKLVSQQEYIMNRIANTDTLSAVPYSSDCYSASVDVFIGNTFNPFSREVNSFPMHDAAYRNRIEIMKLFLKYNCNMDFCNQTNETPIYVAARFDNAELAEILLEQRFNPDLCNEGKESPVYAAANNGHLLTAKVLLEYKCDVNLCNYLNQSPLYIASANGHTAMVKLLLSHCCKVDINNYFNQTALYIACHYGHDAIVQLLLEHKCNPHLINKDNQTPIYIASRYGRTGIARKLMNKKCDLNICNKNKRSPLWAASSYGHIEIVRLLLENSSNPDLCDKDGESPLYTAASNGHAEIVKLLLQYKSKSGLCNKDGVCPKDVAALNGYTNITKILSEHKIT